MRLSHSLPIIEDAVFRLGLSNDEIAYLLETEVERTYFDRGKMVHARVMLDSDLPGIQVFEVPPIGSSGYEIPILNPLQPNPQAFLESVERYKKTKVAQVGWELALGICVAVEQDYSLVELHENPSLKGEMAILPHSRLAATDRAAWHKGIQKHVVIRHAPREHRDGIQHWHSLNPKWSATRNDSVFLRRLVQHFFDIQPHMVELYAGVGMIVLDEKADLGAFVGKGGENVKALEAISGARQLVVARAIPRRNDRWQLKKAIEQLTPLRRFAIAPPENSEQPWSIVVHPKAVKLLVGTNGCRLMFVSRLSGLKVQVVERTHF